MKHPSTRAVFDYWNRRRGSRPAPERGEIEPTQIRHALGDTFMLAADFVDTWRFRLAGTRICALFCREIKGEAFTELWAETNRRAIEELAAVVEEEHVGAVAGLIGRTEEGHTAELEMLLLPLAHGGHARIRALGVLALTVPSYWLGATPVEGLELTTLRHIGAEQKTRHGPRFGRTPETGHLRHGLVVYRGGRESPPG